jgi:cysteine desulfurase
MLSIVGHKFGAPKGVAALYVSKNTIPHVAPLLIGGAQELGRRAGTENVLLIVGLGEACRIFHSEWRDTVQHMLAMKTRLIRTLREHITRSLPGAGEDFVRFNGPDNEQSESENLLQLPNTVSVSFKNVRASQLMPVLADKVAVSAGSACHSSHALESMSAVLAAMKVLSEYEIERCFHCRNHARFHQNMVSVRFA